MKRLLSTLLGLGAAAVASSGRGADLPLDGTRLTTHPKAPATAEYAAVVRATADMVNNPGASRVARRHSLDILNLTWEDTGRYKDSAVGSNISDMTIQVGARDARTGALTITAMPVIRYPNFSDKTCDIDPRDFTLLVGNERPNGGTGALQRVSLHDFLQMPTAYLTHPDHWRSPHRSLLAPARDDAVLVSAQACFLPVPRQGEAVFNPVVFNYQSSKGNPAVLTVLATREGTSATIIDNARDAFETGAVWGQRLFHNAHGQRASLTGTRESDFRAAGGTATPLSGPTAARTESALNMVLLIQIPLKHKEATREGSMVDGMVYAAAAPAPRALRERASNVENAVIGHGDLEGPFTETAGLPIERDPRYPVRVTVQFYKATNNGVVSDADLASIKDRIDRVYAHGTSVGSLVTGGETGRITEYAGAKVQPADWWERFWELRERETGKSREEITRQLRELLGQGYQGRKVTELYLRDCFRAHR